MYNVREIIKGVKNERIVDEKEFFPRLQKKKRKHEKRWKRKKEKKTDDNENDDEKE